MPIVETLTGSRGTCTLRRETWHNIFVDLRNLDDRQRDQVLGQPHGEIGGFVIFEGQIDRVGSAVDRTKTNVIVASRTKNETSSLIQGLTASEAADGIIIFGGEETIGVALEARHAVASVFQDVKGLSILVWFYPSEHHDLRGCSRERERKAILQVVNNANNQGADGVIVPYEHLQDIRGRFPNLLMMVGAPVQSSQDIYGESCLPTIMKVIEGEADLILVQAPSGNPSQIRGKWQILLNAITRLKTIYPSWG